MKTAAAPSVKDQWTAYAQSLRLWVVQVIVWLAEWTGARELRLRARSELRFLRREVRDILLARMAIEMVACPSQRRRKRRAHVREWLFSRRKFHRYVLRGMRLRTFGDARRVLDDLEAHVARCIANFRAGMSRRRVVKSVEVRGCAQCVNHGADAPDTS